MSTVGLDSYSLSDLESLEFEHPELGRIEIIRGSLITTGVDVTGDRHQTAVQALYDAFMAARPLDHVIRLDTYWFGPWFRIRPDLAVWRGEQRPADGGAFRDPPLAVVEVLSDDRARDLEAKAEIYAAYGIPTWFVDPAERAGWWLRDLAGHEHRGDHASLTVPGWSPVDLDRSTLSA